MKEVVKKGEVDVDDYNGVVEELFGDHYYKPPIAQNTHFFNPLNSSFSGGRGGMGGGGGGGGGRGGGGKRSLKLTRKTKKKKSRKKKKKNKKEKNLKSTLVYSRSFLHDNGVLELMATMETDAGEYKCVVDDWLESRSATVTLTKGETFSRV